MSIELNIAIEKENDIAILELSGELDDFHAPKLLETIQNQIDNDSIKNFVIDLDQTTFIDSVGLGALANTGKKLAKLNGHMEIICNKPQLMRLLSASGLIAALHKNVGLAETKEQAIYNINTLD